MKLEEIAIFIGETRADLLGTLASFDKSLARAKADKDSWSVAEIIEHLGKVERLINIALMKIKRDARDVAESEVHKASISGILLEIEYDQIMQLAAFPNSEPGNDVDLEDAIETLRKIREKTNEYFREGGRRAYHSYSFDHPYLGKLSFYEWFYFIGKHEEAHAKQLKMNISKILA
jgi:hypothetical protein